MLPSFWIVVLIKDFTTAKSRLASVLEPSARRRLAEMTAARALDAALALAPTLAVCGSIEAADLARQHGAALVVEPSPSGQNPAAMRGLAEVAERGAEAALLLSSDLPLVDDGRARGGCSRTPSSRAASSSPRRPTAARAPTRCICDRPATSRSTSARPRCRSSRRRHESAGRRFIVHEDPSLGLDLDEPSDLTAWRRLEPTG